MMARKKKIHHRHNRLSFGGKLAFVLLTILSAVILIPIVFTFLYSFFPQSEITAYLKGRGSYDTTKWLDVLYSPAMFSLRQYYKIFIEEPSYLKLFCNSMMYTGNYKISSFQTVYSQKDFGYFKSNARETWCVILVSAS